MVLVGSFLVGLALGVHCIVRWWFVIFQCTGVRVGFRLGGWFSGCLSVGGGCEVFFSVCEKWALVWEDLGRPTSREICPFSDMLRL